MRSRTFVNISSPAACISLFPKTVSECQELVSAAKKRALASLKDIYDVGKENRTFENTAECLDIAITELDISTNLLSVIANVFPSKEVRDESIEQMKELKMFSIIHFESNRQLYHALKDVQSNEAYQTEYVGKKGRNAEYAFWLEETLDKYKRGGMELPEPEFQNVASLKKDIMELCTVFQQNINEDATELQFPTDALRGVSESVVNSLKKGDDGKHILKLDYPTFFEVMANCEIASTRQAMFIAFNNRAYPQNENVLRDIIHKRHQLSVLLGYPSYAHLSLADKMVKSPDTAQSFVDRLIPKLQKKWADEIELIKKHLHPSCSLIEGNIQSHDITFMKNQIDKTLFNVDEAKIQEYFPMNSTVKALFSIYQAFFDLTFSRIDNGSELWHKDVFTLEVKDNRTEKLLGYIILDLFPREGKYTHACCHTVVPPVRLRNSENEFYPSLSVVIANFPAATNDRPSLFLHRDAQTFFHEFGHAIHSLMGRSQMSTFAGLQVKRDFVELPSQMLEEWLWDSEILQMVTCHYETEEALPKELIEVKIRSKNSFIGYDMLRQLCFASYSLSIFGIPFSTQPIDRLNTSELFYATRSRIAPGVSDVGDTHFENSFGHLLGYGAGYYGYMWSKVFALDVFNYIKSHNGLMDPKIGRRYVDSIIGVGGGRDPNESLREFLGREPNDDAFFLNIGI
ncbi:unnamed protein product [Phytomonas sp. EM1]|nr:unnamed protein product [Phytomonas sp. EM1]|eukprot:CCW61791.1 unnamed protein product [Phytomonas sp. isolate EM1]